MTIPDTPQHEIVLRFSYRLDLEYDGTNFCGWQIQPRDRTVQQCVQDALETLFRQKITLIGAGRTDTGVHATGQVAHFRSLTHRPPETVQRALNAMLPPDIRIKSVLPAADDFHARFSAHWRGYRYRIATTPVAIGRSYCWNYLHELNLTAMQRAASHILGNQQFQSFAHFRDQEKHYLSSVYRAEWLKSGSFYEFHIEANRFLHGMVRLLVGTFVGVGRAMIDADEIPAILAAQDVKKAGYKAPSCGLTLIGVGYEPWNEAVSDLLKETAKPW